MRAVFLLRCLMRVDVIVVMIWILYMLKTTMRLPCHKIPAALLIRRLTSIRGRAFRHSRVMQTNKMGPSRIYERREDHRQHFLVVFLILYILRSIIPADTKVTGMSLWLNGLRSSSIQSVGVGYFLCGIRFLFGWTSSNIDTRLLAAADTHAAAGNRKRISSLPELLLLAGTAK